MRIATLQFTPVLGNVDASIRRAEDVLQKHTASLVEIDLLVLPELAFTGMSMYSFLSYVKIFVSRISSAQEEILSSLWMLLRDRARARWHYHGFSFLFYLPYKLLLMSTSELHPWPVPGIVDELRRLQFPHP